MNQPQLAIRRKLERLIGRPVSDPIWELLVRDNWVSELQQGFLSYQRLAQRVEEFEHLGQPGFPRRPSPSKRRQRRLAGRELRIQALAMLLADEARRRDDVQAFRNSELSGKLFKFEDATAWVREEADAHRGQWGQRVTIDTGPNTKFSAKGDHYVVTPPLQTVPLGSASFFSETLKYVALDSEYAQPAPACSPRLERLRVLSRDLAKDYWWNEAWATMFVLTDETPPLITASVGRAINPVAPSMVRMTLSVDISMSPREVSELYAKERLSLLGRRPRLLNDKQVRLAMFMADFKGAPKEAMLDWNKRFPQDRYNKLGLFNRDAARARELLLATLVIDPSRLHPSEQMVLALQEHLRRVRASTPNVVTMEAGDRD